MYQTPCPELAVKTLNTYFCADVEFRCANNTNSSQYIYCTEKNNQLEYCAHYCSFLLPVK